jgi:succinoglycan biosynthesis protein ExoV
LKLTYYKADIPNFGDDLNELMWDALIAPGFLDEDEATLFIGIGSILWDRYPKTAKKLVMGSGYAGYAAKPDLHDGSWEVAFVRGPRTAKEFNLDPKLAITDAAILTRFMALPEQPKTYKVSFMPHFRSIARGNWKNVCEHAGIHFIDPTNPDVMLTLKNIQQSELLITEAMHGAILADTLRVPWVALQPIASQHREKWFDWSESLNIELEFHVAPSSSLLDYRSYKTGKEGTGKLAQKYSWLFSLANPLFLDKAAQYLLDLAKGSGQMSDNRVFELKSDMALDKLSQYCDLKV